MTGLMMPLILPTTTSGLSACADAVATTRAATTFRRISTGIPARSVGGKTPDRPTNLLLRETQNMRLLDGRQLAGDALDVCAQAFERRFVRRILGNRAGDFGHAAHMTFGCTPRGDGRRAEADPAGDRRLARLAGYRGHAGDDPCAFQRPRERLPRIRAIEQLHHQQVVVGTPRDALHAASQQALRERPRIADHLFLVLAELWLHSLAEADRLGRD